MRLAGADWGRSLGAARLVHTATQRRNLLEYAASAQNPSISKTNRDKLERTQLKAARVMSGTLWSTPTEGHPPLHVLHPRLPAPQHSLLLHTSSFSRFLVRSLVSSEDIVSREQQKLHGPAMLLSYPSFPSLFSPSCTLTHSRWPELRHQYPPAELVTSTPPSPLRSPPQKSYIFHPLWPPTSTAGLLSPSPPHERLLLWVYFREFPTLPWLPWVGCVRACLCLF